MSLPRLVVTGASGFLGRTLLDLLKERYFIIGLARRSQRRCDATIHENICWHQVDIADVTALQRVVAQVREAGGADIVVHLAAHYDFTGEDHTEYHRTNVQGLRNVLDACRELRPRRFVFASSVAACGFPESGAALIESSAADGDHIYARTKRAGEDMLAEYANSFPSNIIRFAALFSDWCEYPPLYAFLQTWLSGAWNARVLGGSGASAIPYLHLRDAGLFVERVLERVDDLDDREILLCSPDNAISHGQLFDQANLIYFGRRRRPVHMPRVLCHVGVLARDLFGRLLGERPFERTWMVRYIDKALAVDASHTRKRLDWTPRPRLEILRRIPFMVEHLKTDPHEWHRRNRAAMKAVQLRSNLVIHQILDACQDEIQRRINESLLGPMGARVFPSYQRLAPEIMDWRHRVILRHLLNAIRTREKGVFMAYCKDLAERRFREGFGAEEVCAAMGELERICTSVVNEDPRVRGIENAVDDNIGVTIEFGCDQFHETYEALVRQQRRNALPPRRRSDDDTS